MFIVYADRSTQQLDLFARREGFMAEGFSHVLAADGQSGTVTLQPEELALRVGAGPDDFERIRIFGEDGELVGAMTRSPYGGVAWSTPMWVDQPVPAQKAR
jgi:hypothetical protein